MSKFEYLEKVNKLEQEAYRLDKEGWLKNELFTWQWWVLLALIIIPWVIWLNFADRKKLLESVLFGALIMIMTTLLDLIGMTLKFWRYPTQLVPLIPRAFPFDMAMVPVAYMFLYQYFNSWKSFSIALTIMSVIYAFVGEPISVRIDLVQYIKWQYIYSFFYYFLAGLFVRWFIIKIKT